MQKKNFEVPVSEKKSYSELSDKEKEVVRSSYKDLLEIDVPPYPKKGIVSIVKPVRKAYEKVAREGRVVAAALIKTKYTPGNCNGSLHI